MKAMKQFVLATFLFINCQSILLKAQDPIQILKKMDHVLYSPKDQSCKMTIVLISTSGKEKTRQAFAKQKGTDKKIFRFTSPASQAGIATLSLPNDVMYLYLPSFGKERRISSSVKKQKFAGTDFSYDDLEAKPYAEKYTPGPITFQSDGYLLPLVPISRKSEYSKLMIKIHKTDFYPLRIQYYDKGKAKIKEAVFTFEKIDGYWSNKQVIMTDLKKGHKTKIIRTEVKFDTGMGDEEFSIRKLMQ